MKPFLGSRTYPPALLAAAAGLCVYLLWFWKNLLLLGQIPTDGNMLTFWFPIWARNKAFLTSGVAPLWDAYKNLGEPFLADPQKAALYPPMWLTAGGDFLGAVRLWIVFHALLAFSFTFLLFRRLKYDPAPALLGALLAAFNGYWAAKATLPNHLAAASWLPALLYFQVEGKTRWLAAAVALQWLAGFPPYFLLSGVLVLGVAAARGRREALETLKAYALGLALCAVQWIPFLEMLARSDRGVMLDPKAALAYCETARGLLMMIAVPLWAALFPSPAGDPAVTRLYWGCVPAALAIFAVWRGGRAPRLAAAALLGCLVLSTGVLMDMGVFSAPLRLFRFPAHWILPATALLVYLAVEGYSKWSASRGVKLAALVFAAAELLAFNQQRLTAWTLPGFFTDVPALARPLIGTGGRVWHTGGFFKAAGQWTLNSEDDYLLERELLFPSFATAFDVREAASYQVLAFREHEKRLTELERSKRDPQALERDGIALVVDAADDSRPLARDNIRIQRGAIPDSSIRPEQGAAARIVSYASGKVVVDAQGPGRIRLLETFFPGWRATLDGRRAPIGTEDGYYPSVTVPEGSHRVEFFFLPASVLLGLAISLLALAATRLRLFDPSANAPSP